MPSRGIRNRAMRVFLVMGNLAEVHAKNFVRRRVIHRSCGEQLLRALLDSMNNSGIAISPAIHRWVIASERNESRQGRKEPFIWFAVFFPRVREWLCRHSLPVIAMGSIPN